MDYVSDALAGGTRLRAFVIVDDFTRECLPIEVYASIPGLRATRILERIAETRQLPKTLICDNGPEFTGRDFDSWAFRCGVRIHFIRPGKPAENAYAESFNAKFRDECLNESWFVTLADARSRIEDWRLDYNQALPHSGLETLRRWSLLYVTTRLQSTRPRVEGQVRRRQNPQPRSVQFLGRTSTRIRLPNQAS